MTPEELRAELGRDRVRSAYLLAGEEALHRDDALEALVERVLSGAPRDFNLDRLDGASTTPAALGDTVRALPVMAERRLVVLREPAARRAGGRALRDAIGELIRAAGGIAPTVLVVSCARVDRRERWVRAFAEPNAVVACDRPRGAREAKAFVLAEAKRQGVDFEPAAAELLVERIGPELLLLRQEIAKAALLAGPGERIRRAQVAASASDLAEEPIWDLTDAIGEGRAGDAVAVLAHLLAAGTPPMVLLAALAGHFRKLLRLRDGAPVAAPPFVRRKLEGQARRYAPRRLLLCLDAIHDADEVLKGRGSLPPGLALERLVLGLSG